MKSYLALFQNVKFNVGLFSVLAVASVMGTLIPQIPENPDKVQEFMSHSPRWGYVFQKLDFFNIYYSTWFVGLLGLLAFDVIVCKLVFGKFPGISTFKSNERTPEIISSQQFRHEWMISGDGQLKLQRFAETLKSEKYTVQHLIGSEGKTTAILAGKHRAQRFGSWISHVSILFVLLANLTGALYGFREVLNVIEGGSERMRNRPWVLTCDKFILDRYPGTSTAKTYASDLRLFQRGQLVDEKRILVNEPLEYDKVRFYQASYGPYLKEARIGFFLRKSPTAKLEVTEVTLRLDEDVVVPGTDYTLRILQFIPDFSMNENREVASRSPMPENPALQILVSRNGKPVKAPWIFERMPMVQMPPIQKEDEFILVLAKYVPSFYTGIQIAYDPGADLFWLACTILVLGLMTLFYFHHRKIWIFLDQDSLTGKRKVLAGGYSSRGSSFEDEFLRIVSELKAV